MPDSLPSSALAPTLSDRRPWPWAGAAFIAIATIHLASQLFDLDVLNNVTQVFLMPALAATVVLAAASPRSQLVRLLLVSLFFSWLGDSVPRFLHGDPGFLAMVGFFLIAQVVFIVALWPHRSRSILRKPVLLLPYLAFFGLLIAVCAPNAGSLLVPVIFYGLTLLTMAVLSTGLGPVAALGGALFFLSDGLIAFRSFSDFLLPQHGFLVMLTYIAAQAILAYAFVTHARSSAVTSGETAS